MDSAVGECGIFWTNIRGCNTVRGSGGEYGLTRRGRHRIRRRIRPDYDGVSSRREAAVRSEHALGSCEVAAVAHNGIDLHESPNVGRRSAVPDDPGRTAVDRRYSRPVVNQVEIRPARIVESRATTGNDAGPVVVST